MVFKVRLRRVPHWSLSLWIHCAVLSSLCSAHTSERLLRGDFLLLLGAQQQRFGRLHPRHFDDLGIADLSRSSYNLVGLVPFIRTSLL